MNLKRKVTKGLLWNGIETWGSQLISFLVFFVLARILGPDSFGIIALAGVYLSFLQIFLDQGLSKAIIQRQQIAQEHLDTAFWINISISIALTILSIASAHWIAIFFKEPNLTPIIRWLSFSFIISSLNTVQQALLEKELNFKPLAVRTLAASIAGGAVGILMAFLGYGVWSLVGQKLTAGVTQVLTLWWISNWRPGFKISVKHFQELFSFGISVMGFGLLNFFNRRLDDLLIGYYLGPVALGYYTVAYRLLRMILSLFSSVTGKVLMPVFAKLQSEREKAKHGFYNTVKFTSILSFPCFLGIAILAPELIQVFFGEAWRASIPVMQILAIMGVLQSVSSFNNSIFLAFGKPSWTLILSSINVVLNGILFFVVVRWGIIAVAIAYTIRGYLLSPIPIVLLKRLIPIRLREYYVQYLPSICTTSIVILIIYILRIGLSSIFEISSLKILVITSLLGAISYILLLHLIFPSAFQKIYILTMSRLSKKEV